MMLTRIALGVLLTCMTSVAQDWMGTWKLHSSTDPGEDPQKRPQTLVIGENGWLIARIEADGNPSAFAVRDGDDGCTLIGAPSRYTCTQNTDGDRSQFRVLEAGKEVESLDAVVAPDGKSIKVRSKRGSSESEAVWVRVPDRPASPLGRP